MKDRAPEDIIREEQEAQGQQTVREQLAVALEAKGCDLERSDQPPCIDERPAKTRWCETCLALDRHRAEPECSEARGTECPSYQDGYADGLEAQREPAGRGTA